mmetsp:Transcript_10117/g.18163  ORF Transcript_10117/g.18163 Transcript_10117/m.18163 type:complete len:218 (-) Transcript_10117:115-768(-)
MGSLSSQNLLPTVRGNIQLLPWHVHGEDRRGGVTQRQTGPVIGDPIASILHAHAASSSVESEANIPVFVRLGQIGKLSVSCSVLSHLDRVAELEVADGIGEPAFAEALPVADVDVLGSKHVPHGHFIRASVGGGDDSDEVIIGDAEHALRFVDGEFETFLSEFGSVGAAEAGCGEVGNVVTGVLFAWARGEFGVDGLGTRGGGGAHPTGGEGLGGDG